MQLECQIGLQLCWEYVVKTSISRLFIDKLRIGSVGNKLQIQSFYIDLRHYLELNYIVESLYEFKVMVMIYCLLWHEKTFVFNETLIY